MIFVFSGTGNSYHVAKRIASDSGTDMVEMSAAVKYGRFFYNANGEDVGFVFPVYYLGLPSVVERFLEKVEVRNAGFVYAVSTCAGQSGKACEQLRDILGRRLSVDAFFDVLMPDSAVFYENVPGKEEAERINRDADSAVDGIIADIKARSKGDHRRLAGCEGLERFREAYSEMMDTEVFSVDDKCIECRICEHVCPEEVIKVYHRKPIWDEPTCSMCMSCVNLCPKQAIQMGDVTKQRGRYYHPDYYMWSLGVKPPYKCADFEKYDKGMRY